MPVNKDDMIDTLISQLQIKLNEVDEKKDVLVGQKDYLLREKRILEDKITELNYDNKRLQMKND